ncbi:MAG: UDP-N-acetylmuramoyl-L-alanyl-D-glutamate--2,6-diaminopimelate ligase [Firmicutes bacterium]|nr:UDP-N-acetylmuramoyl-L-alanyl-D-glutamate--2,6-diaminopimelate ligase [Bacillota bacterium]
MEFTLLQGAMDKDITAIAYHSENTGPGTMFVCIDGVDFDGHTFAKEAVDKGSAVLLCSKPLSFTEEITVILVPDCRRALAEIAAVFYGHPSKELMLIGITGTKGKTTVSWLLREAFRHAGIACGLIGTIENDTGRTKEASGQTTPESLDLQRMLREMADSGCRAAVIEVSSQALKQGRVYGLVFDLAVLTGISRDHIGPREHADFQEYLCWKSRLFCQCKKAVVNADTPHLKTLLQGFAGGQENLLTYGLEKSAGLGVKDFEFVRIPGKLGVEFQTKGRYNIKLVIGAPGRFSLYNGLAVILAAKAMELPEESIRKALMETAVPGRHELFAPDYSRLIMVDYAHNGASLGALLQALRAYHPSRITCIFGCGGERDPARRYGMGKAAAKYADFSIITADNPRKESLDSIIRDIIKGMGTFCADYTVIPDRKQAIETGIRNCQPGEIVVIAGKGHETMQLLAEGAIHFDDREVVRTFIEKVKHEQDYNRRNS